MSHMLKYDNGSMNVWTGEAGGELVGRGLLGTRINQCVSGIPVAPSCVLDNKV